jgi:ATP-dependent RNA helicase DeaD
VKNFKDFNLSEPVSRAIAELGFETPSQIQEETLPILLGNRTDFLGLAATGTGKTAAFAIPLLERLKPKKGVQALILCPTRELAIQVAGQVDVLGKYKGVKALPIYGGTGYGEQLAGLRGGANVVVGTPGRVVDHITKGYLNLGNLEMLVLDEADEMISMGFQEDLEAVLKAVPPGQANIWLFSATMGAEVRHVADAYLKDPQKVQVNRAEMLPSTVEQLYYKVHEYDKPEVLCKLIDAADDFFGIVFCQTKALVVDVNSFLSGRGYKSDCLHGDMDQTGRDRVMRSFRERKISVLVATDVACRGLDVKDITHVVNYSIPRELDNYVHRIGRTGRIGKAGIALSLVTFSHRELIGRIERMTKSKMQEGKVPSAKEIALKRVSKVRAAIETRGPQGRVQALLGDTWKDLLDGLSKEEIASRFLSLLCPDLEGGQAPERLADTRAPAPAFGTAPTPVARPQPKEGRPYRKEGGRDFKKNFSPRPGRAPGRPESKFSRGKPFAYREGEAPGRRPPFGKSKHAGFRAKPWEGKPAPRVAAPIARALPAPAGPVAKGPRWKSPGTAKLGAKPRWKVSPAG